MVLLVTRIWSLLSLIRMDCLIITIVIKQVRVMMYDFFLKGDILLVRLGVTGTWECQRYILTTRIHLI